MTGGKGLGSLLSQVITISRQLGSGGRRIAEALGEILGFPVYDKEILEILAKESGWYQKKMFEVLDERVRDQIDELLAGLLPREFRQPSQYTYFHHLPKVISTLSQTDCIILGRGAHLLLPDSLKVRIEASMKTRVENMIHFEKLTKEEAKKKIMDSDKSRERFIRHIISLFPGKCSWIKDRLMYDLVINTDHFKIKDATSIIMEAAKIKFDLK